MFLGDTSDDELLCDETSYLHVNDERLDGCIDNEKERSDAHINDEVNHEKSRSRAVNLSHFL